MAHNISGFLARAVEEARMHVALANDAKPMSALLREIPDGRPPSFLDALSGLGVNIIAEIKYRSPSRGPLACAEPPDRVAMAYAAAGAAAISVLTNGTHFGGSLAHLRAAAHAVSIPAVRKDFIVDPWQVIEARVAGAASCLLIAAAVDEKELADLISCARQYSLEPLVEVHLPAEYERARKVGAQIIGVNSRDLKTLAVDLAFPFNIARIAEGDEVVLVAESGIDRPTQVLSLREAGYQAFLIGSALMSENDPGAVLRRFLEGCHVDQDLRHHESR